MSLGVESATFGRFGMHVVNNSTPFPHTAVYLLEENRLNLVCKVTSLHILHQC